MPNQSPHNCKRRKAKRENPYPDLPSDRCYLAELPIEILSNILQFVYPADLPVLSRTNNYLRKTLLHPQQQHIWKTARVFFPRITIPDPIRISEMTVASLLFDSPKCSICTGTHYSPLKSHVQPIRICEGECTKTFEKLYAEPPSEWSTLVYGIVPSVRFASSAPQAYRFFHIPSLFYQARSKRCRKEDMQPVLQDIEAGLREKELQAKYNTTSDETECFNRYMDELGRISWRLHRFQHDLDSRIQRFATSKLTGFKNKDLGVVNSLTFCSERRRLLRCFREFTEADWNAYPPRAVTRNPHKPEETIGQCISQEMRAIYETAQRRRAEAAARRTRQAVMEHWGQLMNEAGSGGPVVPRWNEFQALPVINTLLKSKAGANDLGDLKKKDSILTKMIQENVNTWDNRTRGQFRKILKMPIPKKNQVQEPDTVPPLDRVTSLFECTQCKSVGLGLAQEGTLTFYSAVKHICLGTSRKFRWDTTLFQPDQYGIQIARYVVNLSERSEDKTTRANMDALGARFLCKLCPKRIHLTFGNLIGHLKRHGVKELQGSLEYLAEPPALDPAIPSSAGLVEKRRRGSKKGFCSDPGSDDFFVCRHCNKSLLWNALVSHVKAKHNFPDIRDEDFYPKPKPESADVGR